MVTSPMIIRAPLHCDLEDAYRGAIALIGNLDGVHLGHQELVRQAIKFAGAAPTAAIVFEPHPRRVFQPDTPPFLLTDLETKADLLTALGVSQVFVLPFVEDLFRQTPEIFIKNTLHERLGVVGIVTGSDFQFGAGRAGDANALKALAEDVGMRALAVDPVPTSSGEKYASSTIRQALREGEPEVAATHLGRPFAVNGIVIEGRKLARTLNFPTANMSLADYVRPKFGVYAVRTHFQGHVFDGVANIGVRPTVDGTAELLEVHLFDADQDLYGQSLYVELIHFLRPEQKFDDLEALKTQIAKDAAEARHLLTQA